MRMLLAIVVLDAACGDDDDSFRVMRANGQTSRPKPKPKPVDLTDSLGAGVGDAAPDPRRQPDDHPDRRDHARSPTVHYVTLADGLANHTVTVRERGRAQLRSRSITSASATRAACRCS